MTGMEGRAAYPKDSRSKAKRRLSEVHTLLRGLGVSNGLRSMKYFVN